MNQRDTKMRGPRPPMGRVNRDHGSGGPGAFGYGRSGTLYEGQSHHNSYNNLYVTPTVSHLSVTPTVSHLSVTPTMGHLLVLRHIMYWTRTYGCEYHSKTDI